MREGVVGRVAPRPLAVGDRLHQRVAAEPVRAVHGDACDLAGGVEALERGRSPDVGVDAAHVVVGARSDGDRLVDRVDAREHHRELARPGQPLEDLLGAEVPQVEQHVALDPATLVDLGLLGAGDDVARGQLHRVRRVALEEALALGVEEVRAFAAAALGDQHARRRERRRVELHHLHVLQRHAGAQGHRHRVARARPGVRRPDVEPARAAGGEDRRLRRRSTSARRPADPRRSRPGSGRRRRRAASRSTPRRRGCRA